MSRLFTLREAELILPQVESAIREALQRKQEYQETEAEGQAWMRRVAMLGGARVDHSIVLEKKARLAEAGNRLREAITSVEDHGCLVKDLDIGLVDFPTLFHDEEVYLCWKLGEDSIGFWHGVSEGFRGRKPIDTEFLGKHRGEPLH